MLEADVTAPAAVVTCEDLVKVFRSATGETHALRGIGLEVLPGVLTVVAGPSGSGKSSLLTLLGARDRPSAGQLHVLGSDIGAASTRQLRTLRRRRIGFVPQRSSEAVFPHVRGRRPASSGRCLARRRRQRPSRRGAGRGRSRRPGRPPAVRALRW